MYAYIQIVIQNLYLSRNQILNFINYIETGELKSNSYIISYRVRNLFFRSNCMYIYVCIYAFMHMREKTYSFIFIDATIHDFDFQI